MAASGMALTRAAALNGAARIMRDAFSPAALSLLTCAAAQHITGTRGGAQHDRMRWHQLALL